MKILCLGPHPSNMGGVETFVRNLKKIFKSKISFYSITNVQNNYSLDNSYKVYQRFYKNLFKKFVFKIFRKIYFLNFIKSYDMFILNSPKMLNHFFKKSKATKILIQHQTADLYWKKDDYFGENKKLLKRAENDIDLVITLSPYDKLEFEKNFNFKRVEVIRHMSEMPVINEAKKKNKNLIMVCRLENRHKRLDLAINAMKTLQDYTLNIYGNGPDEKMLKELADDMKNIVFHGSTNKVQEKLDENGIYVMTSDYEGYGISNIEAMRRGLPIILRDTYTAARDIVQENGVLLENEWDEGKFVEAVDLIYRNYSDYSKKSIELGKRHSYKILENEWNNLIINMNKRSKK